MSEITGWVIKTMLVTGAGMVLLLGFVFIISAIPVIYYLCKKDGSDG